jgi:hypothetical protein
VGDDWVVLGWPVDGDDVVLADNNEVAELAE